MRNPPHGQQPQGAPGYGRGLFACVQRCRVGCGYEGCWAAGGSAAASRVFAPRDRGIVRGALPGVGALFLLRAWGGPRRGGSDLDLPVLLEGGVNGWGEVAQDRARLVALSLESGNVLSISPVNVEAYKEPRKPFIMNARQGGVSLVRAKSTLAWRRPRGHSMHSMRRGYCSFHQLPDRYLPRPAIRRLRPGF